MRRFLIGTLSFFALVVSVALIQVARPFPSIEKPRDVFGFAEIERSAVPSAIPPLQRFGARDGSELSYRFYESSAERVLIFVHGSSYHGAAYHPLAERLAGGGRTKVVLPNLRGHYQSGLRRGDVDYIGQLEDDVIDLIGALRKQGHHGSILLGGHSSGGGFPIRFAGGAGADLVSGYLLLAPIIPTSNAIRGGNAGGWANLHGPRLFGLIVLGILGIHGFDGLPIIEFNKPEAYWDGTETLAYSYRLNTSYHPRVDYESDLKAIPTGSSLVVIGEMDQSIDPDALKTLFEESVSGAQFEILPEVDHFGVFGAAETLRLAEAWLDGRDGA